MKPSPHRLLPAILIVILWTVPANTATIVRTGREPGFFTGWHRAVIVARVKKAASHMNGAGAPNLVHMPIEPMATIAGTFDPSEHPTVDVDFFSGTLNIPSVPDEGDIIMIVIEDGRSIVPDECEFMPDDHALVVLKGPNDARVQETLRRIREARAHSTG